VSVQRSLTPGRRRILVLLQVGSAAAVLWALLSLFGTEPLRRAAGVLSPATVLAALGVGLVVTVLQTARWRLVSDGFGVALAPRHALVQVYQASFLNSVLPGGLTGDAVRALRQGAAPGASYRSGIGSVVGERLAGTVIVLLAAVLATAPLSLPVAAVLGAATLVAIALTWPSLGRLGPQPAALVWLLSVACWCALAALFLLAAATVLSDVGPTAGLALAAICLAGMTVPLSVGGWGPREAVTAVAAMGYGLTGPDGLAVSAAYGLLALVSTAPGAVLLAVRALTGAAAGLRRAGVAEGELGADVAPQQEASGRGGQST